jgi:DNA-binding SARP family transcriptional activator
VIHLRTLGESVIEVGQTRVGPSAPHVFATLLYLALGAGRRVPRSQLQDLLFPDSDKRYQSQSLRQLLYRIKRLGVRLDADASTVSMSADAVRTDFAAARLDLTRVAGGVLPGFTAAFSRPFAEWLDQRRTELVAHILRALTSELAEHRRAAHIREAEQTARAMLALDPFNEEATLALAESMALVGSKLEAVQLLEAYLGEVGPRDRAFQLPAATLRRRIAERLPDRAHGGATRMVGREATLLQLRAALQRGTSGESVACHVWGEAGIGKTRVVTEFSRATTLGGARVEQVSAQPHDVRRPMGAFTDLVPALLRLPGALGCSPEAIGLLRRLFRYDAEPAASPSPDIRDAELLSANITRSISELLDALTSESMIVLLFEDAQWLDPISLRVLADLIAERKHRRLLVILTSREAAIGVSFADAYHLVNVRLQPLSADDARSMLIDLLEAASQRPAADQIAWCLGAAAGNPFFLQSLAAHYVATGSLQTIPAPLASLLDQRLTLLDPRSRRVFEACSILGRHSTIDRLEAVLGAPTLDLLDGLQTLEEQGFVRSEGGRIVSTHVLLSDIALSHTPSAVRTLLHRNAARVLQDEPLGDGSATLLWDCAEHWAQAGDRAKAFSALRACARHALEIGHPDDACDVLVRASELTDSPGDRLDTTAELMFAAEIAERWQVVISSVRTYMQLAAQQGHPVDEYDPCRLLELDALVAIGAEAAALLPACRRYAHDEAAPPAIRIRAATTMSVLSEELLSPSLATEAFEAANRATAAADGEPLDRFKLDLIYHVVSGQFERAIALARTAAETPDRSSGRMCKRVWLAGFALLRVGLIDEGSAIVARCFAMASERQLHSRAACAAVTLACLFRDLGRTAEAREWHARAVALMSSHVEIRRSLNHLSNCVLFALDERDFAEARRALDLAGAIPAAKAGLARQIFLALEMRVKQVAESYDCTDAELQELLDGHALGKSVGFHDEMMVTLWNALVRRGRAPEANALVRDYVSRDRGTRWPLSPELRVIARELTAHDMCPLAPILPTSSPAGISGRPSRARASAVVVEGDGYSATA